MKLTFTPIQFELADGRTIEVWGDSTWRVTQTTPPAEFVVEKW